jgi:hypothetical protein
LIPYIPGLKARLYGTTDNAASEALMTRSRQLFHFGFIERERTNTRR